jgi:hypothetical protein
LRKTEADEAADDQRASAENQTLLKQTSPRIARVEEHFRARLPARGRYVVHRASFGTLRAKNQPSGPGIPNSRSFERTRSCICSTEMSVA